MSSPTMAIQTATNQHHHPQKSHLKWQVPERLDMKQQCCNELQSESGTGNVIIPMLITP